MAATQGYGKLAAANSLTFAYDVLDMINSFKGQPVTNTIPISTTISGIGVYNNPGFTVTIATTGEYYKGSPIYKTTYKAGDKAVSRLASTDGFGLYHGMGTALSGSGRYLASIYFKTDYPLAATATNGFSNTYSNINGWGANSTGTTRYQEGEWTRLYTEWYQSLSGSYATRTNYPNAFHTVNTTSTTTLIVSKSITTSDLSDGATNTYSIYNTATPLVTGLSGVTVLNHGLDTGSWTKITTNNQKIVSTDLPFTYYVQLSVPSTSGVNTSIRVYYYMISYNTKVTDNKYWKITFDTASAQTTADTVIETYWTAPMIQQINNSQLPPPFTVGTRSVTDSLKTLVGNSTIDLTNVSFDSLAKIDFDGTDDWISIPTYTFGNGNWAVNVWVKPDGTSPGTSIVSNSSGGAVSNAMGIVSGKITYRNYDGSWKYNYGNTTLSAGKWYMLTWINYAGATAQDGTMKMYVNGVLDSSTFNSYTTNGGPCNAIGRNWYEYFNGKIDIVQFYNKSLSDFEITQTYEKYKTRFNLT